MRNRLIPAVAVLALLASFALVGHVFADPPGGTQLGISRVSANSIRVHTVVYRGGEQADFAVVGDGTTTLNIIVKNANGVEVCRTTGPGDRCRATWIPSQTGAYQIFVVNEGGVYNDYAWKAY